VVFNKRVQKGQALGGEELGKQTPRSKLSLDSIPQLFNSSW